MENPFLDAQFWREHPLALLGAVTVLALVVGSFLNVVILRLPRMLDRGWRRDCRELLDSPAVFTGPEDKPFDLVRPPSTCPGCGHAIRAWENVPVLSYLALRGRCAGCSQRISIRYPLIELAAAVIAIAVLLRFGMQAKTVYVVLFSWALLVLALIDMDHQILPDDITQPLLWAGLLVNVQGNFVPLVQAVLGAVFAYLLLWCIYWAGRLMFRKEGLGFGDFKLLAALGAWMGWPALPMIILMSAGPGLVFALARIASRRELRDKPMPFGPWLALGGWVMIMWGEPVQTWWSGVVLGLGDSLLSAGPG